ncbi:hypothetical protein BO221_41335 [Archangium sp. Cb G35]|nr:hypothetical protein BO221_41335 [Archangium sp. Cb G35]
MVRQQGRFCTAGLLDIVLKLILIIVFKIKMPDEGRAVKRRGGGCRMPDGDSEHLARLDEGVGEQESGDEGHGLRMGGGG